MPKFTHSSLVVARDGSLMIATKIEVEYSVASERKYLPRKLKQVGQKKLKVLRASAARLLPD